MTLLKQFILQKFPGILALHEVNSVSQARIFLIVDDQVHVWTLTPSDMVLTAHITYQNRHVFSEIHTQVAKLAAFCYHHYHDCDYHHCHHCSRFC